MDDVSSRQRVTFLAIAAAIAVVAIVTLATGGSGDDGEPAASDPSPTATATEQPQEGEPQETATPEATPKPRPPLVEAGDDTTVRFTEGETARLRIRSDIDDEIHIHGYDITKAVQAGKTVAVSFKASITGIFEMESHVNGEPWGKLRVDPR
jgi:hypothetical protein